MDARSRSPSAPRFTFFTTFYAVVVTIVLVHTLLLRPRSAPHKIEATLPEPPVIKPVVLPSREPCPTPPSPSPIPAQPDPGAYGRSVRSQWIKDETAVIVLNNDMNSTFFFIEDRPEDGIDPIRKFVHTHEGHARALFRHLLYRPACKEIDTGRLYGTGCAIDEKRTGKRKPIVLDVGCNRGYYSLMSASYGHTVYAFDPQPHCSSMLSAMVLLNGFDHKLKYTHAYVSHKITDKMTVRKRTGCTGTFPNDNDTGWADSFRRPLEVLEGANDEIEVGGVRLDDMFNSKEHDILLMKVDVEGHEAQAIASSKKLLEDGAVQNVFMELNLPMMGKQKGGLNETKTVTRKMVRWLMHDLGYQSKTNVRGMWGSQTPMSDADWDLLLTLKDNAWTTLDAWFYKEGNFPESEVEEVVKQEAPEVRRAEGASEVQNGVFVLPGPPGT